VKLPGKVATKLKLPRDIGKRTIVTSKAGTAKVRVTISTKAAKKLPKAHPATWARRQPEGRTSPDPHHPLEHHSPRRGATVRSRHVAVSAPR
jgi:hypothetical protein